METPLETIKGLYLFDDNLSEVLYTNPSEGVTPNTPIVFDCGSHFSRVGWGGEKAPRLNFASVVGKLKNNKGGQDEAFVGSGCLTNSKKILCRSPFENNIIVRFDALETIFDFSFSRLGLKEETVNHPIVFSESMCNLAYSRSHTSELLFECYNAPSICYGIDSLFSFYNNSVSRHGASSPPPPPQEICKNGVIISVGHTCTHVYCVLDGKVQWKHVIRCSVGGSTLTKFLYDSLNLNYPHYRLDITELRCEKLKAQHCYVSQNYEKNIVFFDPYADLRALRQQDDNEKHSSFSSSSSSSSSSDGICLPLPETTESGVERVRVKVVVEEPPQKEQPTEEERKEKEQKRRERGKKMAEATKQRREKMLEDKREALETYLLVLGLKYSNPKKFEAQLKRLDFEDEKELETEIKKIQKALKKAAEEKGGEEGKGEGGGEGEEEAEREREEEVLLGTPDEDLSPDQIKKKRLLKMKRGQKISREREKKEKKEREEAEAKKREEEEKAAQKEEENRLADPEGWLRDLQAKRARLLYTVNDSRRRQEKGEGRHGKTSLQRMKLLAEASMNTEKDITFGVDDSDWKVYEQIATNVDNAAARSLERQEKELAKIESLLSQHEEPSVEVDYGHHIALGVERVRVPEVLFKPYLVGIDELGVGEALSNVLLSFNEEERAILVKNVFLTGGSSLLHHFGERIKQEIRQICPEDTVIHIYKSESTYDAWKGASLFTETNDFSSSLMTKKMYEECGGAYMNAHFAANPLSGKRKR